MKYNFYGSDNADCKPINGLYKGISSPAELYGALCGIWCAETCAPRLRGEWTAENKTKGQCSVTAFLVQDIFGGKVYGIPLGDGNFHCYNVIGDCCFDLTSEQFGERAGELEYKKENEQTRETHFAKEEKRLRYEKLCRMLKEKTDNAE